MCPKCGFPCYLDISCKSCVCMGVCLCFHVAVLKTQANQNALLAWSLKRRLTSEFLSSRVEPCLTSHAYMIMTIELICESRPGKVYTDMYLCIICLVVQIVPYIWQVYVFVHDLICGTYVYICIWFEIWYIMSICINVYKSQRILLIWNGMWNLLAKCIAWIYLSKYMAVHLVHARLT